jgi:hypothetical protein
MRNFLQRICAAGARTNSPVRPPRNVAPLTPVPAIVPWTGSEVQMELTEASRDLDTTHVVSGVTIPQSPKQDSRPIRLETPAVEPLPLSSAPVSNIMEQAAPPVHEASAPETVIRIQAPRGLRYALPVPPPPVVSNLPRSRFQQAPEEIKQEPETRKVEASSSHLPVPLDQQIEVKTTTNATPLPKIHHEMPSPADGDRPTNRERLEDGNHTTEKVSPQLRAIESDHRDDKPRISQESEPRKNTVQLPAPRSFLESSKPPFVAPNLPGKRQNHISIGRIEVQVNNRVQAATKIAPASGVGQESRRLVDVQFLNRFSLKP